MKYLRPLFQVSRGCEKMKRTLNPQQHYPEGASKAKEAFGYKNVWKYKNKKVIVRQKSILITSLWKCCIGEIKIQICSSVGDFFCSTKSLSNGFAYVSLL